MSRLAAGSRGHIPSCWMRRRSFPPVARVPPLTAAAAGTVPTRFVSAAPLRDACHLLLFSLFFLLFFFIPLRFPPPRAAGSALETGHHSRPGWPPPRAWPRPHLGGEGATGGWPAGSPPSKGWLPSLPPAFDLQTPSATAHRGARCWAVVFHKGHTGRGSWDWGRESGGCGRSSPLSPPIGISQRREQTDRKESGQRLSGAPPPLRAAFDPMYVVLLSCVSKERRRRAGGGGGDLCRPVP